MKAVRLLEYGGQLVFNDEKENSEENPDRVPK
jgi:hypothetical protein